MNKIFINTTRWCNTFNMNEINENNIDLKNILKYTIESEEIYIKLIYKNKKYIIDIVDKSINEIIREIRKLEC